VLLEEEEHPLEIVARWEYDEKQKSKASKKNKSDTSNAAPKRRGSNGMHFSLRRSNWVDSEAQPKQLLFKQWFYAPGSVVEEEARRAKTPDDAAHWLEFVDARWCVMNGLYTVMPAQVTQELCTSDSTVVTP
jgi:hypothetical protein